MKIVRMKSSKKELNSSKETVFGCKSKESGGDWSLRDEFKCDIVAGCEEIAGRYDLPRIYGENGSCVEESRVSSEMGLDRSSYGLLEEVRDGAPEPGSGRVKHLVKAFEKLLSINKLKGPGEELQQPLMVSEMQDSSSPFQSEFFVILESLDLNSLRYCSLDSSQESIITYETSVGSRRSGLSSPESTEFFSRRHRRRWARTTSPKPFMLQTEERGKIKEEQFMKKLQQMMEEEEKLRTPTTQGLPWTTEEPECLVKPPAKENTRPIDLVLHSDTRAVERAGFNHQVAKKISLLELYRKERGKQQKLEEEKEIRRLRRELVPKAQPMPYFDRPFVPKRSMKHPTIPREPKFQIPLNKKMKSRKSLDGFCLHK